MPGTALRAAEAAALRRTRGWDGGPVPTGFQQHPRGPALGQHCPIPAVRQSHGCLGGCFPSLACQKLMGGSCGGEETTQLGVTRLGSSVASARGGAGSSGSSLLGGEEEQLPWLELLKAPPRTREAQDILPSILKGFRLSFFPSPARSLFPDQDWPFSGSASSLWHAGTRGPSAQRVCLC